MKPKNISTQLDHAKSRPEQVQLIKFVHITKTAGTSIENIANQSGIKWGRFDNAKLSQSPVQPGIPNKVSIWHLPLRFYQHNPYANCITFCVVRNPYTRMVSEFTCPHIGYRGVATPQILNTWIQQHLKKIQKNPFSYGLHFIPQHLYVYDKEMKPMITHVLHFENLKTEFKEFCDRYQLKLLLSEHANKRSQKVTVENLSQETKKLIESVYQQDFLLLDYPILR